MTEQALATVDVPAERLVKRRIPRRIGEVVNLIVSGECKTIQAAAQRVGMHPNYVYGALKKPEIQVFIERKSRETIANGLMRASARLNELVDAESEHVSFDAAKHVAALAGIKVSSDAQVSVNVEIKAGYVIDISDDRKPQVLDLKANVDNE